MVAVTFKYKCLKICNNSLGLSFNNYTETYLTRLVFCVISTQEHTEHLWKWAQITFNGSNATGHKNEKQYFGEIKFASIGIGGKLPWIEGKSQDLLR